ncbi:hypothetical protein HPB51_010640 [Rhipicephalus microplus]|uniref:SAP domain-containing protein n=1 Tax=Rhipicephalus microplus TaxID=6941 RepID=A0A9J6EPE2_RHIMP|nr:hypothetical protein HPB51_010640 [Rhipicephalus microplus]
MANATKKQLVDELRPRGLRCTGRKNELIARIIRNNITRQALEPTDSSTKDQAAYDDDRQAHLETLSIDNARLSAELSSLRAQLNRATTSERETLHEAHQNASLPTERVTTPTLGLHHSVPADITMSSGSTRPPSLNDGTNQDAARSAAPTVSMHDGEPSMAQILAALVNTQALLANTLSRGPPTTSLIQIYSTSDTSSSIPLFDGTPQQSTHDWITQVERIAALAHWTPSLTTPWTPSKAKAFDVVVPAWTSPETVIDAKALIVGLSEVHCVQHMGGMNFQVTVESMTFMIHVIDAGSLTIGGERISVALSARR